MKITLFYFFFSDLPSNQYLIWQLVAANYCWPSPCAETFSLFYVFVNQEAALVSYVPYQSSMDFTNFHPLSTISSRFVRNLAHTQMGADNCRTELYCWHTYLSEPVAFSSRYTKACMTFQWTPGVEGFRQLPVSLSNKYFCKTYWLES